MSGDPLTITIPEPLASALRAAAAACGLSVQEYAIRALEMAVQRDLPKRNA